LFAGCLQNFFGNKLGRVRHDAGLWVAGLSLADLLIRQ